MKSRIIYLVEGSVGVYSDRRSWTVAAYFDKEQAQERAKNAEDDAEYLYDNRHNEKEFDEHGVLRRNKYDDNYSPDYEISDFPTYRVSEVTLWE